ncbi:hypothetical protein SRHO_G00227450 [Serrasalmus rhombeus]
MAQAAKQVRKNRDLAEAAAQEQREKEEEKIKKRNRSRDRRRKTQPRSRAFSLCAFISLLLRGNERREHSAFTRTFTPTARCIQQTCID